ncbi:MAG: bifunctional [glutamine synthetase] adenylyltransferase/[glutamine synthetase]-adenylyl-L-tyrosine phosphorylase [Hyphomonadaceae bacterium]
MPIALDSLSLGPVCEGGCSPADALGLASEHSPYLARMLLRHGDLTDALRSDGADACVARELDHIRNLPPETTLADAMREMRLAKERAHAAIASADLSGVWSVDQVIGAITDLADASVQTALRVALLDCARRGQMTGVTEQGDLPGLFILAMGKMGARELNYSSDVDLVVLFDLDRLPDPVPQTKERMTRLAQLLVRVLEERTVDGYVFRTDLRLRPDPGSTSPAVSTQFATSYYESVGQNWERMAHIKARVCAGDAEAGSAYLAELEPYIWRRHLDYWAIADIHSIKRQIHAHGGHADLASPQFDVKLGRGGVREIEFFVQVQQLILGGRSPELRAPATKEALARMADAGVVARDVASDLHTAYDFLRSLEHRIQMINDEQTHMLTARPEARAPVASLCGYRDTGVFEADISRVRSRVHGVYSELFAQEERISGETGNLVFTGVDEDPGTVATLAEMGFSDPSRIIRTLQNWHRGGVSATRSARGRQILTTLGPRLLEVMSETGEPDVAFDRFADFFSRLTAGVQVMSLMMAEPTLAHDLIETMAFAPKLATDLARRPALLDAMLDRDFLTPADQSEAGVREADLRRRLKGCATFEEKLNEARRFHREEAFRIGYQLLRRIIQAPGAGAAYADLADACVRGLADAAETEVTSKFGGEVGRWAVCALGKFGGRELTATSDLDLMLVYVPGADGPSPLAARFVQRLVAALSAPTEEGALYEVDMQLRPSGKAGPIAVTLESFRSYYDKEAWTWEFMALTRLRPVAGDPALMQEIGEAVQQALQRKSADPKITEDVLDMRRRLARDRAASSIWDLKLTPGGVMDIEFVVQHALLLNAGAHPEVLSGSTPGALAALGAASLMTPGDVEILQAALSFQLDLQQALRIAVGDRFDPATASQGMKTWVASMMALESFEAAEETLRAHQSAAAAVRDRRIGAITEA